MIEGCLTALFELFFHMLLLSVGWVVIKIITLGNGRIGQHDPLSDQPENVRYFSEGTAQVFGFFGLVAVGVGIYFLLRLVNP